MTGQNLINLIKVNGLEDAEIILGCQGYVSFDEDGSEPLLIHRIGSNKVLIADSCDYRETIEKIRNAPKEFALGDGVKVKAPEIIDVSEIGSFDELEDGVWDLITTYMDELGIKYDEDSCDWYTVKQVQETILKQFEDAGIKFKYM